MKTIGWIGTGVMGGSMCQHLLNAGYSVNVFNRTAAKAKNLVDSGARWCGSVAEVARQSEIICTIVGYPEELSEVMMGERGVLEHARRGAVIIDMTTSTPALAVKLHELAADKGIDSLDVPVSGGDIGAKRATLAMMAGGDPEVFGKVLPLLNLLGENITYMGGPGKGQHTKMCNQTLIASTMIGVVESLLYANRAGLDLEEVISVIGKGAAGSWSINNLGPRIADGDYAPGFFIRHFVKDMRIALDEARRMNLSLPGLALAEQFYSAAVACGYEHLGTQGLFKLFEKLNGMSEETTS